MNKNSLVIALALISLAACSGGGGGSSTPAATVTPPASVPLETAIVNNNSTGWTGTATVSGTINSVVVSGTANMTQSTGVGSTCSNAFCWAQTTTITGTLTGNGQSIPMASTAVGYRNVSYQSLGTSSSSEYDVAQSLYTIPATVSVGFTATASTYNRFTDSTMTTLLGTISSSYVVTADPNSSTDLIVEYIEQYYDTAHTNTESGQTFYKVSTAGVMKLTSVSIQTSTSNYTFTVN